MILENGIVLTGDPRLPRSRALAIAGDRVAGGVDVREGDRSQVSVERIDLDGRCVAPGFTDAHVHFLSGRSSLQQLDLRGSPTPRGGASPRVAAAAPDGEGWLLGGGWHAAHWDREPTRADLDAVAAGRPVLLWAHDHHTAWVSTRGARGAPASRTREVVERDADGQPTGLLREHAAWTFAEAVPLPPPAGSTRSCARACARPTAAASPASTTTSGPAGLGDLAAPARRPPARPAGLGLAAVRAARRGARPRAAHRPRRRVAADRAGQGVRRRHARLAHRVDARSPSRTPGRASPCSAARSSRTPSAGASEGGLDVAVHAIGDARQPDRARRARGHARRSGSPPAGARASSTPSCSTPPTSPASRRSASPPRCSRRTRRPTATAR